MEPPPSDADDADDAVEERTASTAPRTRRGRRWLALSLVLILAIDVAGQAVGVVSDLVAYAFVGFLFAQVGLLVAWAVLGPQRLVFRLAGGTLGVAAVGASHLAIPSDYRPDEFWPYYLALTVAAASGALILRILGRRIVSAGVPIARAAAPQFTIRHILLLTAATAVIIGSWQWVGIDLAWLESDFIALFCALGGSAALVTLAAVAAGLGLGRPIVRLALLAMAAVLPGMAIDLAYYDNPLECVLPTVFAVQALLQYLVCRAFRRRGYALVAARRSTPSGESADPAG